jgi:hypothetical protein
MTPDAATESPDRDVRCVRCGYLLRGLGDGANCPECNTPAAFSHEVSPLSSDDPLYVARLPSGATALLVAASLVVLGVLFNASGRGTESYRMFEFGAAALRPAPDVALVAVWLLAARPTHPLPAAMGRIRVGLCVAAAAAYVLMRGSFLLNIVDDVLRSDVRPERYRLYVYATIFAIAATLVLLHLHLRMLGRRLRDPVIQHHCPFLAAISAGTAVFWLFVSGFYPLSWPMQQRLNTLLTLLIVASCVYHLIVVGRARGLLKRAAADARDQWPSRTSAATALSNPSATATATDPPPARTPA